MMNKTIILFLLLLSSSVVRAQKLFDVFTAIPDTMLSYLDAGMRSELAGDMKAKKTAVVVNSIGDTTRVVTHSSDYILLRCNKSRDMEIKLLPRKQEGDTIVCVVNTYKGPAEESTVDFYTLAWKPLLKEQFVGSVSGMSLLQRPDTLSTDDFQELCGMFDPLLVNIHLSPKEQLLTYSVSLPDVPRDKEKTLKGLISQRKFNWDGERFN